MQRSNIRLVLALLAGGALSFAAGLAVTEVVSLVNCWGETLACNIDQASAPTAW